MTDADDLERARARRLTLQTRRRRALDRCRTTTAAIAACAQQLSSDLDAARPLCFDGNIRAIECEDAAHALRDVLYIVGRQDRNLRDILSLD